MSQLQMMGSSSYSNHGSSAYIGSLPQLRERERERERERAGGQSPGDSVNLYSPSDMASKYEELKLELNELQGNEDDKRHRHSIARANLQESWDNLVQLRTHINKFKSSIESSSIEEITLFASTPSSSSSSSS
jgi:hypothetical protein